jgi:hypothetical protein
VGAGATDIPADIQRSLREIEVTAGYARCRLDLAGKVGNQQSGAGISEA